MRTVRLDDIIGPVCFEETAVVVEVAVICRDAIGAVQYCEEVGQQVDQHQQPVIGIGMERARSKDARRYALQKFSTRVLTFFFSFSTWHKNSLTRKWELLKRV